MNHNWVEVEKDFSIDTIVKRKCTLCGVESYQGTYKHNVDKYLWLKPMGEIQPVCPETCEETIELIEKMRG